MNSFLLIALAAALEGIMILPAPAPNHHLLVREPMVRLVRRPEIPKYCGKGANVEACTAFVGQRLECECAPADGDWSIRARAQVIPAMYVAGPVWVSHEREHVRDVRDRVESYLHTLALSRFDSQEDCVERASREESEFARLMDAFKLESNAAMHPRLSAAASNE